MQATLRFPPPHQRKTGATRRHSLPILTPREIRLSSAGGQVGEGVFQLVVRCAPSQEAAVDPLVRDALAEHLLGLHQRLTITTSGKPLCLLQAIARGGRASCRHVVALIGQLEEAGIRDVRWESVVQSLPP
jgi:hypothetical protein